MGKSKVGKGKNIKERNLEKDESFDPAKLTAKNDHTMSLIRRLSPACSRLQRLLVDFTGGDLMQWSISRLLVRPPSILV
jgi:hypothetical protein